LADVPEDEESVFIEDLSDEQSPTTAFLLGVSMALAGEKPYDPEPGREKLRGWIALSLLGLLAVVILALLLGFLAGWISAVGIKDVGLVIVSPLVTLVGTVLGFYYGTTPRTTR
jgi:hypothetical protein